MKITGSVTIEKVRILKQTLLEYADGNGDLCIDLSEVTDIDLAGIQLLLSTVKEFDRRSINAPFTGALNPSVRERLCEAGFVEKSCATAEGLGIKLRDFK